MTPQLRIVSIFRAVLDGPIFFLLGLLLGARHCASGCFVACAPVCGAPYVSAIFDTRFSLIFDLPSVLCEYLVKEFPKSRTHVALALPAVMPFIAHFGSIW